MIKKKGTFVLRQLMEDFILIPCGKTAETVNQVLTLSETAAFIYERAESAKQQNSWLGWSAENIKWMRRMSGRM